MNRYLLGVSALLGAAATISEQYLILIILVAVVIVMDVISGLIKAFAIGEPISSEKGTKGFWKKMVLLFSMAFAFFLDLAIPYILGVVSVSVPRTLLFGSIVGIYIILNESISICENIYKANKKSLPKWIKKLLSGAKGKIDEMGDEKDVEKDS